MNPPEAASRLDDVAIDESIAADVLALLFRQSFPAVFFSVLNGGLLSWALWGSVAPPVLIDWLAALSVGAVLRLALFLQYFRIKPAGAQLLRWHWPYAVTLVLSAAVWGLGALWLMSHGSEVDRLVVLFFVIGMTAGGVVTYSAHRGMTIAAVLVVMLPSTLWLYAQPGHAALGMAIGATAFIISAVRGTRVMAEATNKQLGLGYQLKDAYEAAHKLARSDELTGINNRRAFMELSEQMVRLSDRNASAVSCLLIDVDHFKLINDALGHGAGDHVLQQIGALMTQAFRSCDICGRVGGEEFAVLLPDTDVIAAMGCAERFREAVATHDFDWHGQELQVSVSIGVALRQATLSDLLQRADMAMYQAKDGGRNRVELFSGSGVGGGDDAGIAGGADERR